MVMSMSLLNLRVVAYYLFITFLCNATAFGFGRRVKGDPFETKRSMTFNGCEADLLTCIPDILASNQPYQSQNLTTLLRPALDDRSKVYAQALELLSSIETSPSCHRLATSTLLDSCQSIDGSKHDSETIFDDTRSIYAAQLAVCEIQSANSNVPPSCEILATNRKMGILRKSGVSVVPKTQLSHCLQSLESRPQWWTSYSNSRQNAVVICQAARTDIEKGETQVYI